MGGTARSLLPPASWHASKLAALPVLRSHWRQSPRATGLRCTPKHAAKDVSVRLSSLQPWEWELLRLQELVQRCGVNPQYEEVAREQGGSARVHIEVGPAVC